VSRQPGTRDLARFLTKNVVPAYMAPGFMVSIAARSIPDRVAGRALGHAAFTTIAVPSALAALVVSVFLWRRLIVHGRSASSAVRTTVIAAGVCGGLGAAGATALFASQHAAARIFLDVVPSCVLGGSIAARTISKPGGRDQTKNRRVR
jgi:hypothetical protein